MTLDLPIDLLTLFARFGKEQRLSLQDPKAAESFTGAIGQSLIAALDNDALLQGQRTERMFEALIVSLGQYKLLKSEDNGTVHPTGQYTAPDFRIVLDDGSQWLVEVKNVYDPNPERQRFRMTEAYLRQLSGYCEVMKCPLKFAIYWARWGMWTLIDLSELILDDGKWTIDMFKASIMNELARLGDRSVGTSLPLRLSLEVDKTKPRTVDRNGEVALTFAKARMFCRDNEITDTVEQSTAWMFMQFGDWPCGPPHAALSGNEVDAIEFIWEPEERANEHQDFEFIGTLSSMFSRYYATHTLGEGKVIQLEADGVPDWFAPLIAKNHKTKSLPLWKFILQPNRGASLA